MQISHVEKSLFYYISLFKPVEKTLKVTQVNFDEAANYHGPRKNNFDFLRLTFSILVIFSHSFAMIDGTNVREPVYHLTNQQSSFGGISVAAFFIISGYLITKSWLSNPNLEQYLTKRALRILPGYFAVAVICSFVFVPLSVGGFRGYLPDFIQQFLAISTPVAKNAFTNNPIPNEVNGSLWTILYGGKSYAT